MSDFDKAVEFHERERRRMERAMNRSWSGRTRDAYAEAMNRYRAWIGTDSGSWRVLVASQLLSILILGTFFGLIYGFTEAWTGVAYAAVALLPVEVFLGVAQMTSWRYRP